MPKLSLLHDHIQKKMQEWEFLGVTSVRKWFKILLYSEFSKNLTLKVCKPMKGMKVTWWCHQISQYHCLEHVAIMTSILMYHQWLSSVNFAHNHTKFSVYKPPNLLNIIFLRFPEIESSENYRIQFLKAFSADFALKNLLLFENVPIKCSEHYVEFICRRMCEKKFKAEFHAFDWFPGIQNLIFFASFEIIFR